jgi:beta-lactamase regulating signal transducer with metallopeptidase domain
MTASILAWLATYAIHSTVLLAGALVVTRMVTREAVRDTIWKAALLGGLVTATLASVSIGFTPPVQLSLPSVEQHDVSDTRDAGNAQRPTVAYDVGTVSQKPSNGPTILVAPLLIGIWFAGALLLLIRLIAHNVRLYRRLRGRVHLSDGPLPSWLAEIRRRAGFWRPVRLSVASACATPIALGDSEICVPERFLTELDERQQRAGMAHEVAHLVRRDPAWQLIAGVIESVFFFQPLNRFARLRLRDTAENLSDDWAALQIGAPLDLARCLGNIASWLGEPIPSGTLAMAEGGSPLVERVRRLTEWKPPVRSGALLRAISACAAVLALSAAMPSVTSRAGVVPPRLVAPPKRVIPDSVIRYTLGAQSLAERWRWARGQASGKESWIGWSIDAPINVGIASNFGGPGDRFAGKPVDQILAPRGAEGSAVILLGFDGENAEPVWVRIRAARDSVALAGIPLYWLGKASGDESITQLRALYPSMAPEARKEVAGAYTLHREFEPMIAAVHDVLRKETEATVRAEAVQWLPRTHPDERRIVGLLTDVANRDASPSVQAEAVDAIASLARHGTETARAALAGIAQHHESLKLRSEAAQALERISD